MRAIRCRLGRGAAWAVPLIALAACSNLVPVDVPASDRRFPLRPEGVKDEAGKSQPCERIGGPDATCRPLDEDLDAYAGGLGRAMWDMDLRRRELLQKAADHTNLASAYDTLLWPVGAFLIAKKIKEPSWSTVDAAAFGAAAFGIMKAGIPGRDRLYLRAAVQMSCALRQAEAELYAAEGPESLGLLQLRLNQLQSELSEYKARRDKTLSDLALKPSEGGRKGKNPDQQRRFEALGIAAAPKAPPDPSAEIILRSKQPHDEAIKLLDVGRRLERRLKDAGPRLRGERSAIEGALNESLNGRAPAPRDPFAVGRELAKAFEDALEASKKLPSKGTLQSGRPSDEWWPTESALQGLKEESRKAVKVLWTQDRTELLDLAQRVQVWVEAHAERVKAAREDATTMGCDDAEFRRATGELARRVGQAASAAAGAAAEAKP